MGVGVGMGVGDEDDESPPHPARTTMKERRTAQQAIAPALREALEFTGLRSSSRFIGALAPLFYGTTPTCSRRRANRLRWRSRIADTLTRYATNEPLAARDFAEPFPKQLFSVVLDLRAG
jgi:hypothetical protein